MEMVPHLCRNFPVPRQGEVCPFRLWEPQCTQWQCIRKTTESEKNDAHSSLSLPTGRLSLDVATEDKHWLHNPVQHIQRTISGSTSGKTPMSCHFEQRKNYTMLIFSGGIASSIIEHFGNVLEGDEGKNETPTLWSHRVNINIHYRVQSDATIW